MSVMGTFRAPILIFGMLPFISLGPASFGFFNSIRAGRKKSIIIMAVMAIRLEINEPGS